jgi:HKD family nuclease
VTRAIWQPYRGRLGDWLIDQLESDRWTNAVFIAAFVRMPGLSTIAPAMSAFRASGAQLQAWVGIDFRGTSEEALRFLLDQTDGTFIVYNPGSSTFHPKMYVFLQR